MKEPLIISITQYGIKHSIELESSCFTIQELAPQIINVALSLGFNAKDMLEGIIQAAENKIDFNYND